MFINQYIVEQTCAKQHVIAILQATTGEMFIGSNKCDNPQETCPRINMISGEGYRFCKEVCKQKNHAEVDVLNKAGYLSQGARIYLIGHTYCCENCISKMQAAGIKEVIIVSRV